MVKVTAALRQRIRNAISAHARRRRQQFIDAGEQPVCAGCGCDDDIYCAGCKICHDRKRRRERRRNADFRARELAGERERRQRKRRQLVKGQS